MHRKRGKKEKTISAKLGAGVQFMYKVRKTFKPFNLLWCVNLNFCGATVLWTDLLFCFSGKPLTGDYEINRKDNRGLIKKNPGSNRIFLDLNKIKRKEESILKVK